MQHFPAANCFFLNASENSTLFILELQVSPKCTGEAGGQLNLCVFFPLSWVAGGVQPHKEVCPKDVRGDKTANCIST